MIATYLSLISVLILSLTPLCPELAFAGEETSDLFRVVPFKTSVTLLKEGKTEDAYNTLLKEKQEYKGTEWGALVNFFSGTLAGRLKLYTECISNFSGSIRITLLSDYRDLSLARCYAGIKEYEKAILTLRKFEEKYPFSTIRGSALFDTARYLTLAGRRQKGLSKLNLFIKQYPDSREIPDAYMLKGRTLESLKKPVEAYEPYRNLYYYFPDNPQADTALKRTIAIRRDRSLKIAITPLYPRKVRIDRLLRKRRYKDAIKDIRRLLRLVKAPEESGKLYISLAQALKRAGHKIRAAGVLIEFLKNYPESRTSAKARYILGKIYWNRGKSDSALKQMRHIVKRFPGSGWAGRALYVSGRICEERGDYKEAINKYSRVVQTYSKNSVSGDALWRTGWIYFNSKEYKKMISLFEYEIESSPDISGKEQLIYWTARAYEKTGKIKPAHSLYKRIATFPFSYYGSRAHSRLRLSGATDYRSHGIEGRARKALPVNDNGLTEKIKRALELTEEPYRTHILKGIELVRLGLSEDADFEFLSAEPGLKGSLEKNMLSGDLYELANNFNRAYRIRDQVLSALSKKAVEKLPGEQWVSFFPLSYREYVLEFSKKEGVDPLLVLSVIRQESVYDPAAHSAANAIGLMQIISETGKRLYRRVFKKRDFDRKILFDPKINLRLGIHYLAGLLARNKSDIVLAIATYNAGPRPVKKWSARYAGLTRDEFIEKIPYPETRRYIKKVLKNYANYKTLYPDFSKH